MRSIKRAGQALFLGVLCLAAVTACPLAARAEEAPSPGAMEAIGIALIALGVACWPGRTALCGMLTYSAAVTLYLAYLGFAGGMNGILLWPAVVLHGILTALLARSSTSNKTTKQ